MTNPWIAGILSALIGYLCGNLLSGYLIGKKQHVDLTKQGSGNVGTTNTFRVLGKAAGAVTLVMDILKAVVSVLIVRFLTGPFYEAHTVRMFCLIGAFFAVLGHDFPFYMHFKGGKGIATSTGMILCLFPQTFPLCLAVMVVTVAVTRYVSLGSVLCAVLFFVQAIVFGQMGLLSFASEDLPWVYLICAAVSGLALWRHRSNIMRLLNHTENKISFSGSKKDAGENGSSED